MSRINPRAPLLGRLLLHGALGVVLGAGCAWLGPPLIAAMHRGEFLAGLARRLSLAERHDLPYYLELWRASWTALVLAWFALGALVSLPAAGRLGRTAWWAFTVYALVFLVATVATGPRQDYLAFLEIWDQVRSGGDPWWIAPERGYALNAYGPLFNLLAWPAGLNRLIPKLLFAWVYLLVVLHALAPGSSGAGNPSPRFRWLTALYLANPSFWIQIGWYGHFDILAAGCCLVAIDACQRQRSVLSGSWLAIGGLWKYVPMVLTPFLAVTARRERWRLLAGACGVMGAGLVLAVLTWGTSALRPIGFAASRGSTLLSIFRFLRGEVSPLRWVVEQPNLDHLATPAMGCALALTWAICWRRRPEPPLAACLGLLAMLLFYRVGFMQYQLVLGILLAWWARGQEANFAARPRMAWAVAAYLVWISAFDVLDWSVGGIVGIDRAYAWLEDWVGLPTFALGVWLWWELVRAAAGVRLPWPPEGSDRPRRVPAG